MDHLGNAQPAQEQYQEPLAVTQWFPNYVPPYDDIFPMMRSFSLSIKRTTDILLSILLLIILALPMAVISFLIRMDSRGPAIFSHERIGKNGKPFQCYKFRTMYNDATEQLTSLLASDKEVQQEWHKHRKLENDPRITSLGNFLRCTSLDELPQLFNVLKGEMSLVGPRPVPQEEISQYYRDDASLCFSVTPGLTGLWQVSGRNKISYMSRIRLDQWYARNWSLWIDMVILTKTIWTVIKREGV